MKAAGGGLRKPPDRSLNVRGRNRLRDRLRGRAGSTDLETFVDERLNVVQDRIDTDRRGVVAQGYGQPAWSAEALPKEILVGYRDDLIE